MDEINNITFNNNKNIIKKKILNLKKIIINTDISLLYEILNIKINDNKKYNYILYICFKYSLIDEINEIINIVKDKIMSNEEKKKQPSEKDKQLSEEDEQLIKEVEKQINIDYYYNNLNNELIKKLPELLKIQKNNNESCLTEIIKYCLGFNSIDNSNILYLKIYNETDDNIISYNKVNTIIYFYDLITHKCNLDNYNDFLDELLYSQYEYLNLFKLIKCFYYFMKNIKIYNIERYFKPIINISFNDPIVLYILSLFDIIDVEHEEIVKKINSKYIFIVLKLYKLKIFNDEL